MDCYGTECEWGWGGGECEYKIPLKKLVSEQKERTMETGYFYHYCFSIPFLSPSVSLSHLCLSPPLSLFPCFRKGYTYMKELS